MIVHTKVYLCDPLLTQKMACNLVPILTKLTRKVKAHKQCGNVNTISKEVMVRGMQTLAKTRGFISWYR